MDAITFDTLKFATRLEKAGVPGNQAKAEAEVLRDLFDGRDHALNALQTQVQALQSKTDWQTEQMATKNDLLQFQAAVASDLQQLQHQLHIRFSAVDKRFSSVDQHFSEVDKRFAEMELRLTLRLGTIMAACVAIVAALKLF